MLAAKAWMQGAAETTAHREELYNYVAETQDLMDCLKRHSKTTSLNNTLDDKSARVRRYLKWCTID
jgi:hypothetical protein